ncbi:MAG TPA: twin-arginine translocation signal domain-containing protein [Anaerolineales bacterium]|nr:twin-arginine translocation signal domain-containing protein [Anaerolineales bacterium]
MLSRRSFLKIAAVGAGAAIATGCQPKLAVSAPTADPTHAQTVTTTPAWEAYWRGILHLCNPTMSDADFEKSWDSLVISGRAFTDFSDPASGNFALHSLTCGGATHEMVTGVPEGKYMRIYTLNSRKNPPSIPQKPDDIDITRHFFATTGSDVLLPDGSYAVYGFPQFENCIVPLMSREDTDLIELSRIEAVSSIQRPYNTGSDKLDQRRS